MEMLKAVSDAIYRSATMDVPTPALSDPAGFIAGSA
jgi:hypothetical protein